MNLYQLVEVWRRLPDGRLVCYRCLRLLPEGSFCVQSADFYDPDGAPERDSEHRKQFLELLASEAPERVSKPEATLEEAIEAFDRSFRDFWQ